MLYDRSLSKLTHTGLSTGLPLERQLASLRASEGRPSENFQDGAGTFYTLISEAKTQETEYIAGHLGGCLTQKARFILGGREEIYSLS